MKFAIVFAAVFGTAMSAATGLVNREVDAAMSCYWDGTAPFCAGGCPDGYHEVERNDHGDGAKCWTGYKVKCCN
ncbi:hypothetical protein VHEMI07069 [[Torrubiella] hemipterigena]|uniref:Uncharacterized protein n=1 Tax=[Torrubiella] hemipterigena TaxID=1531966 RepID=A0A0A1T2E3_9HYPO|nr:hypothetical protein VHEMI07069 [[Torrubiella] hemipterigena]